ncbi:MAG: hypothetical protein Q7S58_19670 [Candidatus Binatus sp.]|uniref:tetratricopeptide repeat protein n=1 Tax=Candidatus Binatus sp. TaxID=2811406 RepID=UPI00271EB689|nr:hypothetical protein [Candidatus Binatus sp.]MDO8434621.1 hypothetical protein [Candidatus Binatus sp.]
MNLVRFSHRMTVALIVLSAVALSGGIAAAQSLADLNGQLAGLSGEMSAAESNEATADQVIGKLDAAEATFAKLASAGKVDKGALIPMYRQLDSMLDKMYTTYRKKKDDCIAQMDSGSQCDYDKPEQYALRALYPLSWLRFQAATTLFDDNAEQSKKLLNQAIDGFTESTLAMPDPNLVRENTLGRAYCERELGKFNKADYDRAIADFKQIMEGGTGTQQYKAAQEGLSTTYMKMGKADEALKYQPAGGGSKGGGQMLHLQTLFAAEKANSDPAKKAEIHKQIIDAMKSQENDKEGWAIDVAAASKYPNNVVEEFGNSSDPFEKWLLANVLLSRKDENAAAKYYAEAAASGKYPKGYKFAADIYLKQKRYDQVEALLSKIAGGGGADAQWAQYTKFALARHRWEEGGSKDKALEDQWTKSGQDYLAKNAQGEHSAEIRLALAEQMQRTGNFLEAAKLYGEVKGNPEFTFTAKFKSAECYYKALLAAGTEKDAKAPKDSKAPKVDTAALKKLAVQNLNEAIKMAPEAERSSPGAAKKSIHEIRGQAIFMLAALLEEDPAKVDYPQVASLLDNYEAQYPKMSEKFHDIAEWRITALDHLGKYDEVNRDVSALVERNKGNSAQSDFIKGLGIDFWKAAQEAKSNNDQKAFLANAKLTVTAYSYFADMAAAGKIPVKNLTGTLSIYAQALQATGQNDKADTIFQQVVKADPASPDANAGLARIAQAKKNWKDAITSWTAVENTAAESDNLWYEAKYNIALVYVEQKNVPGACSKLAQTRAEHPTLGSKEMQKRWDTLQKQICLDHKK